MGRQHRESSATNCLTLSDLRIELMSFFFSTRLLEKIAGGDGSRQPTAKELDIATGQGKAFGAVVNQYVAGAAK